MKIAIVDEKEYRHIWNRIPSELRVRVDTALSPSRFALQMGNDEDGLIVICADVATPEDVDKAIAELGG